MATEQFRISKAGIEGVRRRTKRLYLIGFSFVIPTAMAMIYLASGDYSLKWSDLFPLPLMIGVAYYSYRKTDRKNTSNLRSYVLTINDTEVIMEQQLAPAVVIPFSGISNMYKDSMGKITVIGEPGTQGIGIIKDTEGYERIETLLAGFRSFDVVPSAPNPYRGQILPLVFTILTIASFFLYVKFYDDNLPAGLFAVYFAGSLGYYFIALHRDKSLSKERRNFKWWMLIMAIMIVVNYLLRYLPLPLS